MTGKKTADEGAVSEIDKSLEFLLFSGDYDAVIERTSRSVDPATMPALVGALALSGRLDEARSAFRAFSADRPPAEEVTQARFFLVAGLCHAGQVVQALRLVRASLDDLTGPTGRTRFWIWQGLALVRFFEGRFRRARAAGRKALASAMEASFPYARVLSLDLLAHVLLYTGELHAGMRLLDQAAKLAETLGYKENAITLRTSAVVYRLQYLLADVGEAIGETEEALAAPGVSYFTRRNGLVELAKAWALHGHGDRAQQALEEARRIALPGSDRRGKSRWLLAQGLVLATSRGSEPAREVLMEARGTAGQQRTLIAELGFVEGVFVAVGADRRRELGAIARETGIQRAQIAAAHLAGEDLPQPASVEDGLGRILLRCWRAEPAERIASLRQAGLLGLVPWALDLEPGRRLILTQEHLITESRGNVASLPAPTGPSLRVLLAIRDGFRTREDLAETVWGLGRYNPSKHSAVINTAVSRLRGSFVEPSWLVTHEEGYHLAEGVEMVTLEAGVITSEAASPPPPTEEQSVVDLLHRQGARSSAEMARALHMSPSSALRLLRKLMEDGKVRRTGSGRATRYEIA